ncbi:MAG: hypothetical protein ACP5UM_05370 [Anaerolineae bacterium]
MTWRTAGCCQGATDVTQVDIRGDGRTVGLVGLEAAFEQLYALGFGPDDALVADELLTLVKARNYVPRAAEEAYKVALLREYAAFCARKDREVQARKG